MPIDFLHGEDDPAVPYDRGVSLYVAANQPKEFWKVPWPGHTVAFGAKDGRYREALNALADEGFLEADLDQIGTLTDAPDEEPHASAYQGALEGEVAIIRFN